MRECIYNNSSHKITDYLNLGVYYRSSLNKKIKHIQYHLQTKT